MIQAATQPEPAAPVCRDPDAERWAREAKEHRRLARTRGHRQIREIGALADQLQDLIGDFLAEHDPRNPGKVRGCGCHFCRWLRGTGYLPPAEFFGPLAALRYNLLQAMGWTDEQVPG